MRVFKAAHEIQIHRDGSYFIFTFYAGGVDFARVMAIILFYPLLRRLAVRGWRRGLRARDAARARTPALHRVLR